VTLDEAKEILKQWDNNWTREDYDNPSPIEAMCVINYSYENNLTVGKTYMVTVMYRMGLGFPYLCSFDGNKGKGACHLNRFVKIPKEESNNARLS
jgi:hypothetical protein